MDIPTYFLPVRIDGLEVRYKCDDGGEIDLRLVVEGVNCDSARMHEMVDEANLLKNCGRILAQANNGQLISGRYLNVALVVGWAIEHGYLESLTEDDEPEESA